MRKLLIVTYKLFIFILPYLIIIYMFPMISKGIDDFTGTTINQNIINSIDLLIDKIGLAKDSTNSFIDSVGENTKNKKLDQIDNIIEIQNQ